MRINRWLSQAGLASKKQADNWVEAGRVKMNGQLAMVGMQVLDTDCVSVDGKQIIRDGIADYFYWAYHKPVGVVCTHDVSVKNNLVSAVQLTSHFYAVGRLDKASEGLMLLTNNGALTNQLLQPEFGHTKQYTVKVNKPITPEFLNHMAVGVNILTSVTLPCEVKQMNRDHFEITLTQGLNRQIRRMCKALGYQVLLLRRTAIENICLNGLALTSKRRLTHADVNGLLARVTPLPVPK